MSSRPRTCEDGAVDQFTSEGLTFDVTDTPAAASGAGQTVIVLHGFPEDRRSWDPVAGRLAQRGYRVLAPDQRGYSPGARPAARAAYTLRHLAGDVLALAGAAGADRFHLAGHDWGAAVAWYLAGHHPDRLLSVAACSVPHPRALSKVMMTASVQAAMSWYMAAFQVPWVPELAMSLGGGAVLRHALARTGLDAGSAARYGRRAADPAAMRGPVNWYRALPLQRSVRAPRVEVPALYMWGDRDRFISRDAARLCGRYVTGRYRFEVLEGASHWLPQQEAARVSGLLAEHFAAASPPGGLR